MAPTVAEYYANKNIFLTGATGFLGKVLIEKLLRSCPNVGTIYILLRSKRRRGTKERFDELVNCKVFDRLRNESSSAFEKLRVVPGDIVADNLGMNSKDCELVIENCQVVIHGAACVRFNLPLRDAVNVNTIATKNVLDLCESIKKLEVFVYVSTSYCHYELDILEEKVYPALHRPQDIMNCCQWMDNDLMQHVETKLMYPKPNSYIYTKALTEELVSQYAGKFPIAIARPSIVIASLMEPMPGWIDNINGPTGILVGGGKGVVRTMLIDKTLRPDVIPVDMAVNACILLTYLTAIEKPQEIRVCNMTQSGINAVSWEESLNLFFKNINKYPFSTVLWYPRDFSTTSWLIFQLALFFTQFLPALFIDMILYLLGRKTFMMKVQKKIRVSLEVLTYFTIKSWNFKNDYYLSLKKRISKEDNDTFFTDFEIFDIEEYMSNYVQGCRKYVLKEDPSTLPKARRLNRMLYYADKVLQYILYGLSIYLVYRYALILHNYFH